MGFQNTDLFIVD